MAAACAAWTVVRMVRLPKVDARDEWHPLGSKRGQLLDTIQTAVDAADEAGTLPALRDWFAGCADALRLRWPPLPPRQDVYPAYRR
jgi:hypothetical protein